MSTAWLGREQMLSLLGVRPQSLYAYVSRRLIAARPDPADPRRSLYSRADAERLIARRNRGRRAAEVAESAISWGEAVLPTAISAVSGGRLFYRGRDATRLARAATLEQTAALLWDVPAFPQTGSPLPFEPGLPPVEAALVMLARQAAASGPAFGRAQPSLVEEAARLLASIAAALGADLPSGTTIAEGFARRWRCNARQTELIRAALVLMADHELNASTFAARVAASTGAPLAAAALSGFSTLLGPVHGGATRRVAMLFAQARRGSARQAVRTCLARGETLAGFGHPLYPDIDPRAAALLEQVALPRVLLALADEAHTATGLRPNIDFATVALASALKLPDDAPFLMFAAARSAGWLAHAMEQVLSRRLIRPRARYAGPLLEPL